jgi:hypothetical protein
LTSIPALPDATDIDRRSAFMSYTTSSDKAGVTAFYNREMPALGWAADEAPVTGAPENAGPGTGAQGLSYTKDKSTVNILFELSAGGLTVYVQLFDQAVMPLLPTAAPASPAGPAGTGTPAPAAEPTVTIQPPEPASATPTADASASGLPPEAPLYPGASQVQTLSGMGVSFQTADSLDKVVAFYYNHLNNTRWKLMRNDNSGTVAVMTWQAGSATIIITVQAQTNHTQVSIVMTGK